MRACFSFLFVRACSRGRRREIDLELFYVTKRKKDRDASLRRSSAVGQRRRRGGGWIRLLSLTGVHDRSENGENRETLSTRKRTRGRIWSKRASAMYGITHTLSPFSLSHELDRIISLSAANGFHRCCLTWNASDRTWIFFSFDN